MDELEIRPAGAGQDTFATGDANDSAIGNATYPVKFGLKTGLATAPADTFRFIGKGSLRIDADSVTIAGRRSRPFWFGVDETHAFPRNRVCNVQRDGEAIRFDLSGPKPAFVNFEAESLPAAFRIEAQLPSATTEEFEQDQAQRSDFHQRLDRISPRARVTPILVAINCVVFVAMCFAGIGVFQPNGAAVIRWGSDYGPLTMNGQWWRLFTAMFLHFGVIHLALNMWALHQVGRLTERLFGSLRFLVLYVFAGLAGSMASLLWNPQVNGAGASGAIFGVLGGLLAFVLDPRNGVPPSIMKEQRNSTMTFAAYSLFYGFAHAGIDNAAHIGGLFGGLAMGFLLARPLDAQVRARRDDTRFAAVLFAGVAMLGGMAWPLAHPSDSVRNIQAFQRVMLDFEAEESEALAATNRLADAGNRGTVPASDFSHEMQQNVLPLWARLERHVAAAHLQPMDPQFKLQQALLRYIEARRASLEMFGNAVTQHDDALMQKAIAAKADADAAMENAKAVAQAK